MAYVDLKIQRKYQNEWAKNRRLAWIKSKGGCCEDCGSVIDLEVHHVDPSKKVTHRIWSYSAAKREEELKKCKVLCGDCHENVHDMKKHGTRSRYEAGCRCQECAIFMSAFTKKRRAKQKLKSTA